MTGPRTLYRKVWDAHAIADLGGGEWLLYIDRHMLYEVTSPQAFEGLRLAGRRVRRPDLTFAVADHNVPTEHRAGGLDAISDPDSRAQVATLERNARDFGLNYAALDGARRAVWEGMKTATGQQSDEWAAMYSATEHQMIEVARATTWPAASSQ